MISTHSGSHTFSGVTKNETRRAFNQMNFAIENAKSFFSGDASGIKKFILSTKKPLNLLGILRRWVIVEQRTMF